MARGGSAGAGRARARAPSWPSFILSPGAWSYAGFWPATTRHDQASPWASQPTKMASAASCVSGDPRHAASGGGAGREGTLAVTPRQRCRCSTHREKAAKFSDSWDTMHRYAATCRVGGRVEGEGY